MAITRLQIPLGGGVNAHDDPVAIPDGQWQRLRNIGPGKNGIVGQRQSLTFAREIIPSNNHAWNASMPAGFGSYYQWAKYLRPVRFIFDANFDEILCVAITTASLSAVVRHNPNDAAATGVSLKTIEEGMLVAFYLPGYSTAGFEDLWLTVGELGPAGKSPVILKFLDTTYVFGGNNKGLHVLFPDPGLTTDTGLRPSLVTNEFGAGNTNFFPDGAAVVRDRVVYFIGSNLYWSDRNAPLVVGSTGSSTDGVISPSTAIPPTGTNYPAIGVRDIYLGGDNLEPITAVAEMSTTANGSPTQSVCMVFTKNSAYMLVGEPLETTQGGDLAGSLQINRLNIQCGCVSQATICRTPYGTIWAGKDDIWFMPFGSLPTRIGTNIRPYLENQPPSVHWKMHAEYADGIYYLSMTTPGQDMEGASPCGTQFWLDLNGGLPQGATDARWFGPQEFTQVDAPNADGSVGGAPGIWCMARDTRAEGDGKLYALQSYVMSGGFDRPTVNGMSLCTLDQWQGRDTCAPQAVIRVWQANTEYAVGDMIVPRPGSTAAHGMCAPIYVVTAVAGDAKSHATTEPTWFSPSATGTLTDDQVTWTAVYFDEASGAVLAAYHPAIAQFGNEIEWSALSKELVLDDPTKEKLLDGAELGYWASKPVRLTYNSHADQDEASRILTPVHDTTTPNDLSGHTGARVWQRKRLTTSPTQRFKGLTAQWECAQDTGIIIVAGVNDTFNYTVEGITYATSVTAGYYQDLVELDSALLIAMMADTPAGVFDSTLSLDVGCAVYGIKETTGLDFTVTTTAGGLCELFGFARSQGVVDEGISQYQLGLESPFYAYSHPMQLNSIFLRYKIFNRGPT